MSRRNGTAKRELLEHIARTALDAFGPRHWWPAETDEEVVIGAVLTQNTAWKNVEKALANLRGERKLSISSIHAMPVDELAQKIRPAGYYNLKARRLKSVAAYFMEVCGGDLKRLRDTDPYVLRRELLNVYGVGPETADSILLYALNMPIFVIDAYTRRVLSRHGLCATNATYEELQTLFMEHLIPDTAFYNEYHALLVAIGNQFCKVTPRCAECPLFKRELFANRTSYKTCQINKTSLL